MFLREYQPKKQSSCSTNKMTTTIDKQPYWGTWGGISTPSAYVISWDEALTKQYIPRSASISSSVNTALDFFLSKGITTEDRAAVEDFLTCYYSVVAHLYETPEKIFHYFGKVPLKLGVFSDPDTGEQPELYLEVETALSPEDATEKLSLINREWILASNDQDLMSLNITLRFV